MKRFLQSDLMLLFPLMLAGCQHGAGKRPPSKQEAVPVQVEKVSLRPWTRAARGLGNLEPWRQVVLKSETAGRVLKLKAEVGELKKKGDTVAHIDVSTAYTVHQVNRVAIKQARTQVAQTRRDYERAARLKKSGDISQAMLERAQHAYNMAQIQLKSALANLRRTGRSLADSRVRVPFDGIVYQRHLELGAYVMPGSAICTLMEVKRLKLVVGLRPEHAARLTPGMVATARLGRIAGVKASDIKTVEARVHLVRPAADSQTRLVDVEFEVKNPDRRIRPGVVARVAVPLGGRSRRMFIRSDAVVEMMKIQYAYVVEDGKAVRRRVKLGVEDGAMVEVVEGLKQGDRLVTVGQNRLVPGVPVRIVEKPSEAPQTARRPPAGARPARPPRKSM